MSLAEEKGNTGENGQSCQRERGLEFRMRLPKDEDDVQINDVRMAKQRGKMNGMEPRQECFRTDGPHGHGQVHAELVLRTEVNGTL